MIDIEGANEVTPIMRAIGEPSGIPLEVDGETWLLAHGGVAAVLDGYRDRMDDKSRLDGSVDTIDVYEVGRILLLANYDLSDEEVLGLIMAADRDRLAAAVMAALFGKAGGRTYSEWMTCSLHANGLDPEKIPAECVPTVLEMLVSLKRAVPASQFTDAAIAAPRIEAARARAARQAEKAKPPAPSLTEPAA
jgi:hypothetical protein